MQVIIARKIKAPVVMYAEATEYREKIEKQEDNTDGENIQE